MEVEVNITVEERLQKVLAQAGVDSRRKCEELIVSGRVEVNDVLVTKLGTKVDPEQDVIKVDGKVINRPHRHVYIMLNKPKGVITSVTDPHGRKVVMDFLQDVNERVFPIGRLDYDTEGLLLLSNDGEFANLLTHPRHHIPRTYLATVKGVPHGNLLDKLASGIKLEDGITAPAEVEYQDVDPEKGESVIAITIFEGKNRQVRRMFEAIGYPVKKLRRIQYGSLSLAGLSRGRYRYLSEQEVTELREMSHQSHNFQKRK